SLQAALASGDYDAVRAAFAVRPTASVGRQSCDEGLKNTLDEIRKAAKDYLEAGRERTFFAPAAEQEAHLRRVGKAVALLCECATAFSENMRKEMRSENCYDFNAIEHKALDLLCDCVDGAPIPKDKGIAHRYREVMVDEYQDTNDLQDAIFSALSDGGKNLFLVGDVKQCIYRFRRANPANFIQRRREYPAFAEGADFGRIDMSGNFRSRPGICDYVNHTFRLLMTEQSADMDYEKEDELIPMGENFADVGDQPVVSLHMVQTDGNTVEEEARYVAEALLKAHNEGLTVTDTRDGKRTGTTRPMKWSDVLILMRSLKGNTEMKARCYVKALERLCIPVDANTREDLSECEEVVLLLSLLRAVDNPLRDVPLLATLMSPMFDFSPDEIVRIRLHLDRDETNASLYTALMRDAEYEPKSRDFLAKLDRYRRWAGTLPADRLIRRIVDEAGLSAIAYRMENGANAYANLMLFIDYAAGYEAEGFRGLTAFLRYWDRIVKQRESVDCAMSQPSTDAVRILSVHGAKGLEAPIIVLADVAKDINTNDSRMSMIFDEDYGICAKYYDDEAAVCYETVAHTVAVAKSKRDTKAEELRLLYVAMTRATERLWLIVRDKDPDATLTKAANKLLTGLDPFVVSSATSVSEWVLAAALLHPDARRQLPEICRDVLSAPASGRLQIVRGLAPTDETEESAAPPATVCAAAELLEPLTYTYPYEDILRYDTKYAVSQLAKGGHRADDCCTSRPAFIGNERLTPAEKGTATHRFMCFADYALARESVPAEIDRLVSEGRLTREQGDGIDVGTVEAFFESDLYRRVLAADRVLKESRFLYEMPVCRLDPSCESRETVVVQGVADLVLIEPDGVTVIDFKTDRGCTAGELVERYARQLAIYTDAFAADRGLPKKTPYLYSFYLKQAIPVPGVATESEKM
ncbi:MAG: UvrD-helicase domain-containing protein, partial [Clostridia bacterium]|nr:UvrD-helicase domain-containing protein [Clostridia bacterium]